MKEHSYVERLESEVDKLKAQLKEYEDERVGSAHVHLELMGTEIHRGQLDAPVYAPLYQTGYLGKVTRSSATARTEASRNTSVDAERLVIEFKLVPMSISRRVDGKWPAKAKPKKPRKSKASA